MSTAVLPLRTESLRKVELAHMLVPVEGMNSPRGAKRINEALARIPGLVASADFASKKLRLEFDRAQCPLPEILMSLERLGYRPRFDQARTSAPVEAATKPAHPALSPRVVRWFLEHGQLSLVLIAGVLLVGGFVAHITGGPMWLRVTLLTASAILSSTETFVGAIETIKEFRLDVDVMMFAAAIGASVLGHYEEAAFLLFLFGLGAAGEHLALTKARGAIDALSRVAPDTAQRMNEDGTVVTVPAGEIREGDRLLVRPFDRLPADGEIIEGDSAIDQAAITGESVPVDKAVGDAVFAGTMNQGNRLVIRATRAAGESTLARIIRLIEQAQAEKSSTQLFTDKVEKVYVPLVFVATALLIALPPLIGGGAWGNWFYRSMAFLTAASPCALAIGTPATVLCGIARAARDGVLIKGGGHLEALARIRAVAFDKTGTLTTGQLSVTSVQSLASGVSEDQVLAIAAAVESSSSHPLAMAIVNHANRKGLALPSAEDVQQKPGVGMTALVGHSMIAIGKFSLLAEDVASMAVAKELAAQGRTIVALTRDATALGLIALSDRPRPAANEVTQQLHQSGIRRTAMLTGDHTLAAAAIAREVNVDEFHGDLLPQDKLSIIRQLSQTWGEVAMIGDGINDAPALAAASVGIAMGAAGADVAMETADVVLMGSDLSKLPFTFSLAQATRAMVIQNLIIALGVICIVAPLAALGFTNLGWAVLLHEGSTVVVVCNSLRLLLFKSATTQGK